MRILNGEYIELKIESSFYYSIIRDLEESSFSIISIDENKERLEREIKIKKNIYNKVIKDLEKIYKVKIKNIEDFKEDYLLEYLDGDSILEFIENEL
jgi:NAD(P)H-flavin reductase